MRLLPRTLLVRVFLLVAALVVVTVGTWLALFHAAEREPRARQLAQLVGSIANMSRAALIHADPAMRVELVRELAVTEGLRLLPTDPADRIEPLPADGFSLLFADEAQRLLGPRSRLARSVNGKPGVWASFWIGSEADADEYWVGLPAARIDPGIALHWLGWGALALGLALFVAWFIASRIARPMRSMAAAAVEVGHGRTPPPLNENGAEELALAATAFNGMARDLAQVAADRAEVLAGISHDLRTPIARLRLEAEMSVPDDASRAGMIGDLEQMDAIIGQFLDYARGIEAESPAATDACDLIALAAGRRKTADATLQIDCRSPLPIVVRRTAMARALANLIDNAAKYAGGTIEIEATRVAGDCIFEVRDRGPGIPADQVERLKRPFSRLERSRSDVKGTGLGLAIIERIARGHGGRLELLGRDGGGLVARIVVPDAATPAA
jgi:two-component system osmolarity sensor histidine kinase EnvZ